TSITRVRGLRSWSSRTCSGVREAEIGLSMETSLLMDTGGGMLRAGVGRAGDGSTGGHGAPRGDPVPGAPGHRDRVRPGPVEQGGGTQAPLARAADHADR